MADTRRGKAAPPPLKLSRPGCQGGAKPTFGVQTRTQVELRTCGHPLPEEVTLYPGGLPVITAHRLTDGKLYQIVVRGCIGVELLHRQGRTVLCDGFYLIDELGVFWPLLFDEGLHLDGRSLSKWSSSCTVVDEDREQHVYRLFIRGTGRQLQALFNVSPARWALGALTLSLSMVPSERIYNRAVVWSSK